MLTKSDLEAIKGVVLENNKVFGMILKVELAVTNKRVDAVEGNIKELQIDMKELKHGQKRLEQKIDKLDYEERIKQLEKHACPNL